MVSALTSSEKQVLDWLLAGDTQALETLCAQLQVARVTDRESTGLGAYTRFAVDSSAPRLGVTRAILRDVCGETADGVELGFILYVIDGALATLECHLWGEDELHGAPDIRRLFYIDGGVFTSQHLPERSLRDMNHVASELGRV